MGNAKVLRIVEELCIDCGMCRETCPFSAALCALTAKHHYTIDAEKCRWCGGPSKAPCEVYCPVPGAIVPAEFEGGRASAAT
jgi:MinD superfamily P-loop ATPase